MSLTGGVHEVDVVFDITSQGTGTGDGFQLLTQFPDSALPAGTNREGVMIVSGMVGVLDGQIPANGLNKAIGEITTWEADTASAATHGSVAQIQLADQNLNISKGGKLRAIPFMFVRHFLTGGFGLGKYNTNGFKQLQLVARIFRNGDPSTIKVKFKIGNIRMMFWDIERLGNVAPKSWHSHRFRAIASPNNLASEGKRTFTSSPNFPFNAAVGAEQWMVWMSTEYQPGFTTLSVAPADVNRKDR